MMKIYRIYNPNRDHKTIVYDKTPIIDNIGRSVKWENLMAMQAYSFQWENDSEVKEICDCPFIIGSIPVFSVKGYNIIKPFINQSDVQVIPIKVEGDMFYILNTTKVISNILNEHKSKIVRFSSGKIMDIEKYVFNESKSIPSFFRIKQFDTFTFVTEGVAKEIMESDLTGIVVEECQITSKKSGLFSGLFNH